MIKSKPGLKVCKNCNEYNGMRAFECKHCEHPFPMKKRRKGTKKRKVSDYRTLKKGDTIKVIGGSGCYYLDSEGNKHYFTDRGKYKVIETDHKGIKVHGKNGYGYLYMGKKCPSSLCDSIIKQPHKIVLLELGTNSLSQSTDAPKRRRLKR